VFIKVQVGALFPSTPGVEFSSQTQVFVSGSTTWLAGLTSAEQSARTCWQSIPPAPSSPVKRSGSQTQVLSGPATWPTLGGQVMGVSQRVFPSASVPLKNAASQPHVLV